MGFSLNHNTKKKKNQLWDWVDENNVGTCDFDFRRCARCFNAILHKPNGVLSEMCE